MKFFVKAGEAPGRFTNEISFVNDRGVVYSMTANRDGFAVKGDRYAAQIPTDVNAAAIHVAQMLVVGRQFGLVIHKHGTVMRGDEDVTADVYPPGVQPRIHVEGR